MKRQRSLAVVHTDLAQQWATRINRTMAAGAAGFVGAVIETGRQFAAAKKQLGRGHYLRLFAGHPQAVPNSVPCDRGTASRYMAIAAHAVLANEAHGPHLPPAWRTLYELTKLSDQVLKRALTDGRIHPGIERRHVGRLRGAPKRASKKLSPPAISVGTPVARFSREAQHAVDTLPIDDAEALLEQVEALVAILKKRLAARQET